ncbi:ATPase, T2SS/T4P/T4SS family [Burkholderia sp. JKS000303]|uniref:ATPase, T2SS/T4P/T4SS family n=1 Tax=Burkholderia sp. JKS000303 TaxID=1938747 RepID=UPI000BF58052|nr:ATPase, T2SS/T4P/T4SS family [Burkholderia sp. JKS000303]PFH21003.1 pilus assembly protein CpaF [Burkholderia sp. JKS000303]
MDNLQPVRVLVRGRDGRTNEYTFTAAATIGKDPACAIVLKGLLIGKTQARLEPRSGHWYIDDCGGIASMLVNGDPIVSYGPLTPADRIEIGSYRLSFEFERSDRGLRLVEREAPDARDTAGAAALAPPAQRAPAPELEPAAAMPAVAPQPAVASPVAASDAHEIAETRRNGTDGRVVPGVVATRADRVPAAPVASATIPGKPPSSAHTHVHAESMPAVGTEPPSALNTPEGIELRKTAHARLIAAMDLRRINVARMDEAELSETVGGLLRSVLAGDPIFRSPHISQDDLYKSIFDEVIGLGPLESLLADETITEIMVNRYNEIFIEREGRLSRSSTIFTDDQAVLGAIERIVAPLGRRIDESSPMVDARLKDGSRVNAVIPPLALKGPNITIRKFSKRKLQGVDLVRFGSLSDNMLAFLQVAVERRANIVISGGTGSGKTTLLNILSNFIPDNERIVTVEDAAELQLSQSNLVSLEARPANMEGKGAVSIRELVRNTLRMRPDRIVVGECRGGEALDMLQAMNTGHDGSLTTAHANSPRDCLSRLEVMTLMAGLDLPVTAIREQVVSAVDLIVQQTRFSCGTRRVTHVTEVSGMESGTVQMQDVFVFRQNGYDENGRVQGTFHSTGYVPDFYQDLLRRGVAVDTSIFAETPSGSYR